MTDIELAQLGEKLLLFKESETWDLVRQVQAFCLQDVSAPISLSDPNYALKSAYLHGAKDAAKAFEKKVEALVQQGKYIKKRGGAV